MIAKLRRRPVDHSYSQETGLVRHGTRIRARYLPEAPDRRRQSTWKTFLEAHWEVLASVDFTTIEVWTRNGLATCCLLFVAVCRERLGGMLRYYYREAA